ncbi:MAG: leucyl aminopeptidase [Chloroflexi bacterium]|nr:leucyl aminopeptidase [Chloroflexota bacterium]
MKTEVRQANITEISADLLIVNLFNDGQQPGGATGALDKALGGRIAELIALGDCRGKLGETTLLYSHGALPTPRVLVVGLGKREALDIHAVRTASAKAIASARAAGAKTVASIVHGAGEGGLDPALAAEAVIEASLLESYQMPRQSSDAREQKQVEELILVESRAEQIPFLEQGVHRGHIIADSVILARDLEAQPANIATPTMIADTARQMASEVGLTCTVLAQSDMEALGMGILLAVAKGSDQPPQFVILEHNTKRANELPTVVLVGKGITFDTGGYNLKVISASTMWMMKDDMTGAADVIATLRAAALLDVPLHVVGLAPLTENAIDGGAQKPGDVYRGMSGKTMEVISTDAEGRMILADALAYASRYQPDAVIDVATLTGAIGIALGSQAAGLFTEEDALRDRLLAASAASGERIWPMPMYDEYADAIRSDFADVKNTTSPVKNAGVSTSAKFLQHFTTGYPWAHLDIASMAWTKKARPMYPKGASAFGVRLLVQLLRNW